MSAHLRIGLLWRREWDPPSAVPPKLQGMFEAFAALDIEAEPVVYSDDALDVVGAQLRGLDGVLVWVNPIEQGLDRAQLDALLRDAANAGVFVSAHPDVILRMGTKEVLFDTKSMSWGTDTHIYRSFSAFRHEFPRRLRGGKPLVLKQHRGMGGNGVWKIEWTCDDAVLVQHASGGAPPRAMALDGFLDLCEAYFAGSGLMVEQPYQPRLPEGLIRVYLTHDRVVGFTHQYPRGLLPPDVAPRPVSKVFEPAEVPRFQPLRARLEDEWVPEMRRLLDLEATQLPVIWDADFLYGEGDGFVLCEINVSSTFAFPEFAMPGVARATLERIRR